MLVSAKELMGQPVMGPDGKSGIVRDVLFGDRHWRIRGLSVAVKRPFRLNLHYLSEEEEENMKTRIMLNPEQIDAIEKRGKRPVAITPLSVEQLQECASAYERPPVEVQYEQEFARYFRHRIYDDRPEVIPPHSDKEVVGYRPPVSAYEHDADELREHVRKSKEISKRHMHSALQIFEYEARNEKSKLGAIEDLIFDAEEWLMRYLVISYRTGIHARRHLIGMERVQYFDWTRMAVALDVSPEQLARLRRYVQGQPLRGEKTKA